MKKVWGMYFSGTGTTEKVVKRIANTLGEKLGVEKILILHQRVQGRKSISFQKRI